MPEYIFGIDIGGTRTKAVVTDATGAIHHRRSADTGDVAAAYKPIVADIVKELAESFGEPKAIGIAAPGLAARDARSIAWMRGRMSGLQGHDWKLHLGRDVRVINDAHAALLGETWCGAAKGATDAFMLTLGTGVGGAIISDGRLLRGRLGRAGHLGHITVDANGTADIVNTPGSLEDAIGDHTVKSRTDGRFADTRALVKAAADGDATANRIWLASVSALAAAIASLINVLDPEVVILGGGIAKSGAMLLAPLGALLDQFEWRPTGTPVRVVLAELDDVAGAIGAARFAMQYSLTEIK